MNQQLKWNNTPAPEGETDDTQILAWQIETSVEQDHYLVRSYQDAKNCIRWIEDSQLDAMTEDELKEGLTIKIKLVETTIGELPTEQV